MKINGLNWKVIYNGALPENIFGQTDYAKLTINLNPICCGENLKRTLLHEIMHAYLYSYGLGFLETFDKETICEFYSHNCENLFRLYNEALPELDIQSFDKGEFLR